MSDLILKVENVSASQGKFKISNVSFELTNGNILGLVGRSGSGKSTLINTLVGLKRPEAGKIRVFYGDKKIPLNEVMGYSPQGNALYPLLTLEENLVLFGQLYKIKKEVIHTRINNLLKLLDLEKSRKKKITELSGGMQKRADLAVSLIHNPEIIILDEPFAGLDVALHKFIWNLLKTLSKEGKIIIVSSHLLNELQQNCNKYGLIENNYFYTTKEIITALKSTKEKSLDVFLEKLFTRDLLMSEKK
ncbi:ABC transporter ATP-binding protein [archaeon]|nr:ABC transporter ATP-binding protein [archaeon]